MPLCAKQLSTLKSIYTLQYAFLHWFLKVRQPFSGKCTSWIRQNTVSLLQKQRWYLPRKKKIATSRYKTAGSHKAIPLTIAPQGCQHYDNLESIFLRLREKSIIHQSFLTFPYIFIWSNRRLFCFKTAQFDIWKVNK